MDSQYYLQFHISFAPAWILEHRQSDILPVDWVVSALKDKYIVSELRSGISECGGLIELTDDVDAGSLKETLTTMIREEYDIEAENDVFSVELAEITKEIPDPEPPAEEAPAAEPESQEQPEQEKAPAEPPKKPAALDKINALVGAPEFKALAQECAGVAEGLLRNKILDSFTGRSYLISINDGYGLTTYLSMFADLIGELGLVDFPSGSKIAEIRLDPPDTKQSDDELFGSALQSICGRSRKRVVCVDISEWMTKITDKHFRWFLHKIDEQISAESSIVFFRVPFVEKNIIREIESGINDILFVKELSVTPFTSEELTKCAEQIITEKGFTMDDEAWEVFRARIAAEKNDGRFYGINTVNKIIREMLYLRQSAEIGAENSDHVIRKQEIVGLVDHELLTGKSGYEQLAALVGMEDVQKRIEEVVAQIQAAISNSALDTPCIHMRFVGNPGTGKTTVARILGTILKEKGILRNGGFFEFSGRDFCGRYVGETAPKTAAICRDAYGSVLFIDEAYSLYRDDGFSKADYGREAIDTLVAEMENHRADLMVIMAGYPDDMEKLMNGNVGLKSRMPYLIEFPNYSKQQLAEIFLTMADKGFRYDEDLKNAVMTYFTTLSDEITETKDFSNARFVRNLFERTWGKAALRCQMNQTVCDTLTVEDFALATSDKEFHNILEQKKRTIGF